MISRALVFFILANVIKTSHLKINYAEEKEAQKALAALHSQLDDDHNGGVDALEADGFVREELQYTENFERAKAFNLKDDSVTNDELWAKWIYCQVYNWTVADVLNWLVVYVELPEYRDRFEESAVNGTHLPLLASNNADYLKNILKIKNTTDRQKIVLKAKDVVLFGAPKKIHNWKTDIAVLFSLFVAVMGCWFALMQHRQSRHYVENVTRDLLVSMSNADQSLHTLQQQLLEAERRSETVREEKAAIVTQMSDQLQQTKVKAARLVEKNKRNLLEHERLVQAELQVAYLRRVVQELQPWLQVSYEIELQYYNAKKSAAELQLKQARDGCEKIGKKRGSFMGSLRLAHSMCLDDVDKRITEARSALEDVHRDLQERLTRWSRIEALINLPIIKNTGLSQLQTQLLTNSSDSNCAVSETPAVSNNFPPSIEDAQFTSDNTNSYSNHSAFYTALAAVKFRRNAQPCFKSNPCFNDSRRAWFTLETSCESMNDLHSLNDS